jgi:hypothetical protein
MISATEFARSHTSIWKILAPTMDLFVKRMNAFMLERKFPPLQSSTVPHRIAFVNEIGFELFQGAAEAGFTRSTQQVDLDASVKVARTLISRMRGVVQEDVADPTEDELDDSASQANRLERFFRAVSRGNSIEVSPVFPGCGIIDECVGDVYFSNTLYEVKAGERLFRSIDVRQLLTYAALNKAAPRRRLTEIGLFNPRSWVAFTAPLEEICVEVAGLKADELFGEIIRVVSSGDTSR